MKPKTLSAAPRDDLTLMATIGAWPRWPWLPLKRSTTATPGLEVGLMHADHVERPRVYVGLNLFAVAYFPPPDATFKEYVDLSAVVGDGWLVD